MEFSQIREQIRELVAQPLGSTRIREIAELSGRLPMSEQVARFYLGECDPGYFVTPNVVTPASPELLDVIEDISGAPLAAWPDIPATVLTAVRQSSSPMPRDMYDLDIRGDEVFAAWRDPGNQQLLRRRIREFPHFLTKRVLVSSAHSTEALRAAIPLRYFRPPESLLLSHSLHEFYLALCASLSRLGWWAIQRGGGDLVWLMSESCAMTESIADRLRECGNGVASARPRDGSIEWCQISPCPWLLMEIK